MDAIYYNFRNVKPRAKPIASTDSRPVLDDPLNFGYIWPKYGNTSMITVPLAEAKNNLSKLVDDAAAGQVIIIAKHGRALAQLMPVTRSAGPRIGAMKGKLVIPIDLDAPLPDDMLDAFEGRHA